MSVVAEPARRQAAGPGRFEEDVGAGEQFAQPRTARRTLEVCDEALLARVEGEVEPAALIAPFGVGLVLREGTELAQRIALGRLDLDDARAEVRQEPAGIAAGDALRGVDDDEVLERSGHSRRAASGRCSRRRRRARHR